jgi:hypothetical protein
MVVPPVLVRLLASGGCIGTIGGSTSR